MRAEYTRVNAEYTRVNAEFTRVNAEFTRVNTEFTRVGVAFTCVNAQKSPDSVAVSLPRYQATGSINVRYTVRYVATAV